MEEELTQKTKRITPKSKASSQARLIRYYTKHSRKELGLSKTRLTIFMAYTSHICKRDLFLVLRKIKHNESFEDLATLFSMSASTAYYIFKRRVPQIARKISVFIDWLDFDDVYNLNNPRGACENLKSMVDHFVVDRKRKYFISCTPFGFINFLSSGYPVKMANQKMVEQSNFVNQLPVEASVMGPPKYKFLTDILQQRGSDFALWESFEKILYVNMYRMKRINKWAGKPMIVQVKYELRRFRILSDSHLDRKLLPILDKVVLLCAALCNLRNYWWQRFNVPCEVDEECNLDHQDEEYIADGEVEQNEECGAEGEMEQDEEYGVEEEEEQNIEYVTEEEVEQGDEYATEEQDEECVGEEVEEEEYEEDQEEDNFDTNNNQTKDIISEESFL